jgi:hypothetical protein
MNKTWINVTGTAVTGWSEGPEAPTDEWFAYSWRPEKSLAAYEYLEIVETVTEPDPDPEAAENATISVEVNRGFGIRQRADWEDPE